MEKTQLVIQLKNNWKMVKPLIDDQRALFKRLYDCFENIGELENSLKER